MKLVISSGHSTKCQGMSSPYLNEVEQATRVVNRVGQILNAGGVQTITYHDTISDDSSENLNRICNFHNAQGPHDYDISVHFNATAGAFGTEVWYVTQESLARKVSAAMAAAGHFKDRGPKYTSNLFFLNKTAKPSILLEVCFGDSKSDTDLYYEHFEAICHAIAESISGQSLGEGATPPPEAEDSPLPPKFPPDVITQISQIAASSLIASYAWKDRGRAPIGYTKGMAIAYAQAVLRFNAGDPVMIEMAKADTRDDALDALSWYRSNFEALGMSNATAGLSVLRHLYVMLLGLGMRESSGFHCEGRDTSASNTSSDTAETGLFQQSWNSHTCSSCMDVLASQYDKSSVQGYMSVFAEGVTCSSSDWSCYGSGAGYKFQETCKWSPVYAVESCAVGLRNLRQHWGPINRKEAEIRTDADAMFQSVESFVRTLPPWYLPGTEPPPEPEIDDELQALLDTRPDEASRDPHIQWLVDSMDYMLRQQT